MKARPISAAGFAPYGDVIAADGPPDQWINANRCGRFHDRAQLDFGGARAGISLFQSELITQPYQLPLLERHPLGSQAFLPAGPTRLLLVVAQDADGHPAQPEAFLTQPGQGVNLHRGIWHGVLAPLDHGLVFVIDRIGEGNNLQEQILPNPLVIDWDEGTA